MNKFKDQIFNFNYNNTTYYYNRKTEADKVKVKKDENNKLKFVGYFRCIRCNGQGESTWSRDNGICYDCRGTGYITINLNVTKNKETAEKRARVKEEKEKINFENSFGELIKSNLNKTIEKYSDKFYLILDTEDYSTYNEREYLKSKNARWEPSWLCWWIKYSPKLKKDLSKFNLILINTNEVLTNFNKIDESLIIRLIKNNNQKLVLVGGDINGN